MSVLDAFNLVIGADTTKAVKALEGTKQKVQQLKTESSVAGGAINQGLDKGFSHLPKHSAALGALTSKLGGVVKAIAGVATAGAALNAVLKTADNLASQVRHALDEGLNPSKYVALVRTLKEVGVEASAATSTIDAVRSAMQAALVDPGSSKAEVFRMLGVAVADAHGNLRQVDDVLVSISRRVSRLPTIQKEMLKQSLGSLGVDSRTTALLTSGNRALETQLSLRRQANSLSEEQLRVIRDYEASQLHFKSSLEGLGNIITIGAMPAITKFFEAIAKLADWVASSSAIINTALTAGIGASLARLLPMLGRLGLVLTGLVGGPLGWFTLGLTLLAFILEDVYVWLNGGDSALKRFWASLLEFFAGVGNSAVEIWGLLVDIYNNILGTVDAAIDRTLKGIWASIVNLYQMLKDKIASIVHELWYIVSQIGTIAFESIKQRCMAVFKEIKAVYDAIAKYVNIGVEGAKEGIGEIYDWFKDLDVWKSKDDVNMAMAQGNSLISSAAAATIPNVSSTINKPVTSNSLKIDNITVVAQSTDAKGISKEVGNAMQDSWKELVAGADNGVSH